MPQEEEDLRPSSSKGSSLFASQDGILGSDEMLLQPSRLRSLILSKEKELHDINEYRLEAFEQMLRDRDRLLDELTGKMRKLKDDFQYNFSLIEERDAELDRYDVTFGQLKDGLREKDKEISELKMTISELEQQQELQLSRSADLEASYQTRLKEMRDEMDLFRGKHEEVVRRQREEAQALRFDLERQIREKNEEMEAQRREITLGYDEIIKQREIEMRQREDEIMTQLRQLERELGLKQRALERAEVHERRAMEQGAKVGALMNENKELQGQLNRVVTEHEDKMNDLLETLHAVEQAFALQKQEFEEDRAQREASHEEIHRTAVKKRDAKIQSLKEQLSQAEIHVNTTEMALRDSKRELEDKLVAKTRELDGQEAHYMLELERKENSIMSFKTQAWNAEAEIKQYKSKVKELSRIKDDRAHEISRLKEQGEQLRKLVEEANRNALAKAEDMRKEWELKVAHLEEKQKEALRQANEQLERAREEADTLRQRLVDLEAELLRRQEKNFALQDKVSKLEQEGARRQQQQEQQQQQRQQEHQYAPSPLFSEDMGPASPLLMQGRGGGGGGPSPYGQQHQRWSPHPPAIESQTQASLQVQQENEKLRAVVADMRHEMETMRTTAAITAQQQQYQQQQAGGVRAPSPSSYLFSGIGGDRSAPPIPPPPPPPPPSLLTTKASLDQLASENRKLKEDNKKLVGTCDKLMEISNELNSRFNKLSSWMKEDGGGGGRRGSEGLMMPSSLDLPAPPASRRVGEISLLSLPEERTRPSLSAAVAERGRASQSKRASSATAARPSLSGSQPEVAPSKLSPPRHKSRSIIEDDFLLSGEAPPRSRISSSSAHKPSNKASDRTSVGQKRVATRVKVAQEKAATGRATLLSDRKRLIRNYGIKG